jgi:hypothetical protein
MTKKQIMKMMMLAVIVSGLSGCASFNDASSMTYSRTTSVGKELIDLQDAKAKGALTEVEYVKAKKEILDMGKQPLCKEKETPAD